MLLLRPTRCQRPKPGAEGVGVPDPPTRVNVHFAGARPSQYRWRDAYVVAHAQRRFASPGLKIIPTIESTTAPVSMNTTADQLQPCTTGPSAVLRRSAPTPTGKQKLFVLFVDRSPWCFPTRRIIKYTKIAPYTRELVHLIPTFDIGRAETQEPGPLASSAVHGVFWPVRTATAAPDL